MKSWTRTLNLDDAHAMLAIAEPNLSIAEWTSRCATLLTTLSPARQNELARILRDGFLDIQDGAIAPSRFLATYLSAPALAQIDLVHTQWALTHPITLIAIEELVTPALGTGELDIPFDDVETLVASRIDSESQESLRKTRTVLLGALEGIGTIITRGTGKHRTLRASRGAPHPLTFGYLILLDLDGRSAEDPLLEAEIEASLAGRLSQSTPEHAARCIDALVGWGLLTRVGGEIREAR